MAKKKIEEMNEQELAAEKAANPKIEVVNDASKATTEHPVIIPDAKETASFKTSALDTTLNKNATKPTPATPVKQKSDYLIRREEGANRAQQAYNNFVETFGRKPTEDEVSATLGKDLYSWQYVNNKAGNWGNAFGGRELFGQVHGNTMAGLDRNYQTWKAQQKAKETEESKKPMVGMVKIQDGLDTKDVYISKDNQRTAKLIGNSIIDTNNISPEVANRYRTLFMEMGVPVGGEYTESTTLGNIIQGVDDDVLDMLGFYDGETGALKVPHQETYEEILARRERAEEALRLQAQQRELDRQQARLGLADLAAGIGDMIKASGGAIVNPRDYKAMYDSLTAQQQKNFDNYLARMNALKEEEKAKQRLAEERAYNERLLREERAWREGLAEKERGWKKEDAETEYNRQMKILDKKLQAEADALKDKLDAEKVNDVLKGDRIYIGTQALPSNEGIYRALYAYFNENRKYINKDNKEARLNFDPLNAEAFKAENSKVAIALQVQKALSDFGSFPSDMQSYILDVILGTNTYQGEVKETPALDLLLKDTPTSTTGSATTVDKKDFGLFAEGLILE